ncbi:replication factor C large subunit [Candidatus Nitrososphaera gargensis Ga9.2]|uniref:Replication factor C large subunit n=1 Tax=Nitrososphaera gargensis (strain Ga9.2) TaxID=1237085 RepID=K0I772_NITGG|nr:AAA family ATPase [Candidatus Nitrososphaera gargensis]AFU57111.1 replication factor C large subunit [Candidatus Nitrososphaera gargensis Ga9.2]
MMWSEKHRPKTVQEMVGNEDTRLAALKWLAGWVSGSKPLLLVGPPGTGKTTLVHALARQFDYDLVEMNASDARNKDILRARITPVFQNTANLLGRKIMLFLDEVDGISGREDTGGLDTLVELMKEPTVPVIMAANEKSIKIKDLSKVCKTVEFSPVPPRLLLLFLDHVLQSEGAKLGPRDKISIVNNSRGDIRSMLNSAQSRVAGYATVSNRDIVDIDIVDAVNGYFNASSLEQATRFITKADALYPDPRYGMSQEDRRKDMLAALFSSIVSSHVEHDDMASMLEVLSRADMMVGRANARREWRLLKYISSMIASGLYERSRQKGIKYSQYAMPWPVMGPIFARSQSTRKILGELAPALHMSRSSAGSFALPYFIRLIIEEKVDPIEFAVDNFRDESVGESIAKEIEKAKRK